MSALSAATKRIRSGLRRIPRTRALLLSVILTVSTAGAAGAALLVPGGTDPAGPAAAPAFPAATRFYADPDSPANRWVRDHPDDTRTARIRARIADQPQAAWAADPSPDNVRGQVNDYVAAAQSDSAVPVVVAYAIPYRDCGGASSGGAGDGTQYRQWADALSGALGTGTAVVILEPDALAHTSCLNSHQLADRYAELSYAAQTLHRANPGVRVYYDAGNSAWEPARTMAKRLRNAGATRYGDGIAVNVSNFNSTRDETRYGLAVLRALHNRQLGVVVDTSRNGAGPAPGHQHCDPPGRRLGTKPTAATGVGRVDAYLWVKQPGEADGCTAPAGMFSEEAAYQLAR